MTYYSWDYRNRLTEVKVEDNHGTVLNDEQFTYDVNDNRIGVWLNGVQQLYTVYDGSNPYMDFDGNGTLTQRYLTNPNALNQFYGQVSASGTTEWYLTDNINSIRQVISTTGTSLDAITYDPYGNIVSQTNAVNTLRFGYTGATYDPITGTWQDGAREENNGKWLNQDPTGLRPDTNPYRYAGNEPTNAIDPSGLRDDIVAKVSYIIESGFTKNEQKMIENALLDAIIKLKKAEYVLEKQWDKIKKSGVIGKRSNGSLILSPSYKVLSTVKTESACAGVGAPGVLIKHIASEIYLRKIKLAIAKAESTLITFRLNRSFDSGGGTAAYVWTPFGLRFDNIIRITDKFFAANANRIDVLKHELGRLVDFTGEDNTGDIFNDVYVWDNVTDWLVQLYYPGMNVAR